MKNSLLTMATRRGQALLMLESSGTQKPDGRNAKRASQRVLSALLVALFVSLFPSQAHAYAWMIKHGYVGCPVCHADPSGGELLTAYGRTQSDQFLRMKYGGGGAKRVKPSPAPIEAEPAVEAAPAAKSEAEPAPAGDSAKKPDAKKPDDADDDKSDANSGADTEDEAKPNAAAAAGAGGDSAAAPADDSEEESDDVSASSGFLWGAWEPPDWLLLGGSFRYLNVYKPGPGKFATFPMMADIYGQLQFGGFRAEGSLGIARVDVGSPYARASQITAGQGKQMNLLSRTHWVGYDFADGAYTLRAGHLNLPFGIRIPEHTMWVRQKTRTDRESAQQDGVSLAFNTEHLRGEVMGIAGNYQVNPDKYRERGYSLFVEYPVTTSTAIGVSSLVTVAQKDRITLEAGKATRQAHGAFVRAALSEKTVILAEADALLHSGAEAGYVGFAQIDFEAIRGLHFMLTGEALDVGYDKLKGDRAVGAGQPQLGGWVTLDWFCLPHVEIRADYLSRQADDMTLLGQLHVFL